MFVPCFYVLIYKQYLLFYKHVSKFMVYIDTFHIPSSHGASCTFCVIVILFYFLHKVPPR